MLTINQITELCKAGIDVRPSNKRPQSIIGEYDPSMLEVVLYTGKMNSLEDFGLTILNGMISARDNICGTRTDRSYDQIEIEAAKTYEKSPDVLRFIMELYNIKIRVQ